MKKVLGIGNALTDILLRLNDDGVLTCLNLLRGSMQLVDKESQNEISDFLQHIDRKMVAGGSAANTVSGIAMLGGKAGFIGKLGNDEVGGFYVQDMHKNGVAPYISKSDNLSGRCLVLVSDDGERTMCTYLGAASELTPDDININILQGYDIFHIEGYLVFNHELLQVAVRLAKKAGLIVSIDMASFNVVEANLNFLKEIVRDYVDIVFANEEEAYAFTGKEPEDALNDIAKEVSIAVVKLGKDGSYIKSGDDTVFVDAGEADCVDTTGAGDLYASGFLYGLAAGYSLAVCGEIAALVARKVVETVGPKVEEEAWIEIHTELEKIISR